MDIGIAENLIPPALETLQRVGFPGFNFRHSEFVQSDNKKEKCLCTMSIVVFNSMPYNIDTNKREVLNMNEMAIYGISFVGGFVITFIIGRFSFYIAEKVFDKKTKQ